MRVPSLFALLGVLALFASCAPRLGQVVAITALDEAFAAARPALAGRLEKPPLLTGGLGLLLSPPLLIRVGLGEGAGKALDAAVAEKKKKGRPVPIIASPLIAKAIVEGGSWAGDPPLFVPEWRGAEQRGLYSVSTNLVPAYRLAGTAAGAYISALSKEGGAPSCGVLFAESPSRPRAALDAFTEAYAAASGALPLVLREPVENAPGTGPSQGPGPGPGRPPRAETPVSAQISAEASVHELLGMDIRLLFLALGASEGQAIRAAMRPGLVIGADFPYPEWPAILAFRIYPDEKGLAAALFGAEEELQGSSRAGKKGDQATKAFSARLVPALIESGPGASAVQAGGLNFKAFLAQAEKAEASNRPNRRGTRP